MVIYHANKTLPQYQLTLYLLYCSTAFKAPVGGVLFAMEMSTRSVLSSSISILASTTVTVPQVVLTSSSLWQNCAGLTLQLSADAVVA